MTDPPSTRRQIVTDLSGNLPEPSAGITESRLCVVITATISEVKDGPVIDMLNRKPDDNDSDNNNTHAMDNRGIDPPPRSGHL